MFGTNNDDSKNAALNPQPEPAAGNPFTDGSAADSAVPEAVIPSPLASEGPKPSASELAAPAMPPASDDSLMSLKQDALQSLQPLVSHLDQTPEEKFKTTMMLIQATDNPSLVKQAYETANQIKDEKARAQALLDVVNEINYFTHKDDK